MIPGRQKGKGNNYEIKISRILTRWYCDSFIRKRNNKEDWFWRTAGSGAKSTVTRSSQTSFVGDITFLPNPDALKVWVDTKNVSAVSFKDVLIGNSLPQKWYKAELKKRNKLNIDKPVVIIFKLYRRKENYILFKYNDFSYHIVRTSWKQHIRYKQLSILKLDYFLEIINKEDIIDEKN